MVTRRRRSQQADSLAVGHQLEPCVCCRWRRFQMGGKMRRRKADRVKDVREEWILKLQTKRNIEREIVGEGAKGRSTSVVLLLCHRHVISTSSCCCFGFSTIYSSPHYCSSSLIASRKTQCKLQSQFNGWKRSHFEYPQLSGRRRRMETKCIQVHRFKDSASDC